jgi:hypothetical protein
MESPLSLCWSVDTLEVSGLVRWSMVSTSMGCDCAPSAGLFDEDAVGVDSDFALDFLLWKIDETSLPKAEPCLVDDLACVGEALAVGGSSCDVDIDADKEDSEVTDDCDDESGKPPGGSEDEAALACDVLDVWREIGSDVDGELGDVSEADKDGVRRKSGNCNKCGPVCGDVVLAASVVVTTAGISGRVLKRVDLPTSLSPQK